MDMSTEDERGGMPEFVTFTQIANRLNELGLVSRPITRQGVRYIAEHDPNWPIPREQWIDAGKAWVMDWKPVEKFFRERDKPRGRGAAEKTAPEAEETEKPEQ